MPRKGEYVSVSLSVEVAELVKRVGPYLVIKPGDRRRKDSLATYIETIVREHVKCLEGRPRAIPLDLFS